MMSPVDLMSSGFEGQFGANISWPWTVLKQDLLASKAASLVNVPTFIGRVMANLAHVNYVNMLTG